MKRLLLVIVALLLLCQVAWADSGVYVTVIPDKKTVGPGELVTYTVKINNTTSRALSSATAQFNVAPALSYENCRSYLKFPRELYVVPKTEFQVSQGNVSEQNFNLFEITYSSNELLDSEDAFTLERLETHCEAENHGITFNGKLISAIFIMGIAVVALFIVLKKRNINA